MLAALACPKTGGGKIYRSLNGGQAWTELDPALKSITSLSLSPANPNIIYAADRARPVLWISLDGGATWGEIANFSPDGAFQVNRVLAAPGNTVYVSTFTMGSNLPGGKLYKSTDGGGTWEDITGSLPRSVIDLAYAPGDPQTLFATTHLHGAYRSTDGGATWQMMANFPDIGGFDIEVDPSNPQHVLAAGMGETTFPEYVIPGGYTLTDPSGLYQSVNGGTTWTTVFTTTNKCRAVRFHPFNPNLIMEVHLGSRSRPGSTSTRNSTNASLIRTNPTRSTWPHDTRAFLSAATAGIYGCRSTKGLPTRMPETTATMSPARWCSPRMIIISTSGRAAQAFSAGLYTHM